jgi:hypothetical protein
VLEKLGGRREGESKVKLKEAIVNEQEGSVWGAPCRLHKRACKKLPTHHGASCSFKDRKHKRTLAWVRHRACRMDGGGRKRGRVVDIPSLRNDLDA